VPNLKFLATTDPEIWRGLKILKVGHVTPSLFDLILHFCLGPLVINLHAKFDISSFNRSGDMEGVSEF